MAKLLDGDINGRWHNSVKISNSAGIVTNYHLRIGIVVNVCNRHANANSFNYIVTVPIKNFEHLLFGEKEGFIKIIINIFKISNAALFSPTKQKSLIVTVSKKTRHRKSKKRCIFISDIYTTQSIGN